MNQEIKQRWIEALRSGKYKQARDRLRAGNGAMCCLGVLCHIQGCEWTNRKYLHGVGVGYQPDGSGNFSDVPRKYVAGVPKRVRDRLMKLNDGSVYRGIKRHTFAEIADYIEENL